MTEQGKQQDNRVDEALAGSFPASDPPSWTSGGGADRHDGGGRPEVVAPVGSLPHPLVSSAAVAAACGPPRMKVTERLLRDGPMWAAGAAAIGSIALLVARKRTPATWMFQASTWLLLLATYRRLAGTRV